VTVEWWRFSQGRWRALDHLVVAHSTRALRVRPPGPGEYDLRVRAAAPGDTGRYTIKPVAEPPVGTVQVGQIVNGVVDASDPRLDETHYEQWAFTGARGEWVAIDLRSIEIGPSLSFGCWTAEGVWKEIGQNDNVYGTDARLVVQAGGTGECAIRVASAGQGLPQGLGYYTLAVTGTVTLVPNR
jgi:hypothetical protein